MYYQRWIKSLDETVDNEEKRALGIEVEEESELDKGFRDIVELFDDSERRS